MGESRKARLLSVGQDQLDFLPPGFHFEGSEVYVTRDAVTGDVVLSTSPGRRA